MPPDAIKLVWRTTTHVRVNDSKTAARGDHDLDEVQGKYRDASAGGSAVVEPRVTQTQAGLRNAFLLKLRSPEFNPVEWLDAAESKELLAMRKIMTAGGSPAARRLNDDIVVAHTLC